jgi:hypothetical protein
MRPAAQEYTYKYKFGKISMCTVQWSYDGKVRASY